MRKQKKVLLIFFFSIATLVLSHSSLAAPIIPNQIVPCTNNCTPCDLWRLADNIMNFALYALSLPVLTLVILIAGIMMVFAGGDQRKITTAKKMLWTSVIGIFIAFGAWLIINTILHTFANGDLAWGWTKIECPEYVPAEQITPAPSGAATPTSRPFVPDLDNRINADALKSDGITFNSSGSCKDTNGQTVSPLTNFNEMQNGQPLTACQNGCDKNTLLMCKDKVSLNPKVLTGLVAAEKNTGVKFDITSISTGSHAPKSDHYSGNAVDIQPKMRTQGNFETLRNQLRVYSPGKRVECENNGGGITNCGAGTTHVHASF